MKHTASSQDKADLTYESEARWKKRKKAIGKELDVQFDGEFEDPMLNRVKGMTSRYKKLGDVGDWFLVWGKRFIITAVVELPYWIIKRYFYELEGCQSPEHFGRIWNKCYPTDQPLDPSYDPLFAHFFLMEGDL